MDKLIITKKAEGAHSNIVRISGDAYMIVSRIAEETGRSQGEIVSLMVHFCESKIEIG